MENRKLYKEAIEAIDKLFSDTSVSPNQCLNNLENLEAHIQSYKDSLGNIESEGEDY